MSKAQKEKPQPKLRSLALMSVSEADYARQKPVEEAEFSKPK
jgi:hypothetical protein